MITMTKQMRGFTLIELLIVVAIIAILAAIAVPNFLEAQTRAKVSRSKTDLRTIATGLESYRIDNNNYPYSEMVGDAVWLVPGGFPRGAPALRMGGLTSPLAYLTSLPQDAFKHRFTDSSGREIVEVSPYYYERAGLVVDNGTLLTNRGVPVPADAVGTQSLVGTGADTPVGDPNLTPRQYLLFGVGPDLTLNVIDIDTGVSIRASRYHIDNRYDPTNGTISTGNVVYLPGGTVIP